MCKTKNVLVLSSNQIRHANTPNVYILIILYLLKEILYHAAYYCPTEAATYIHKCNSMLQFFQQVSRNVYTMRDESPTLAIAMRKESPTIAITMGDESPTLTIAMGDESPTLAIAMGDESQTLAIAMGDESQTLAIAMGDESLTLAIAMGDESPTLTIAMGNELPTLAIAQESMVGFCGTTELEPGLKLMYPHLLTVDH